MDRPCLLTCVAPTNNSHSNLLVLLPLDSHILCLHFIVHIIICIFTSASFIWESYKKKSYLLLSSTNRVQHPTEIHIQVSVEDLTVKLYFKIIKSESKILLHLELSNFVTF